MNREGKKNERKKQRPAQNSIRSLDDVVHVIQRVKEHPTRPYYLHVQPIF